MGVPENLHLIPSANDEIFTLIGIQIFKSDRGNFAQVFHKKRVRLRKGAVGLLIADLQPEATAEGDEIFAPVVVQIFHMQVADALVDNNAAVVKTFLESGQVTQILEVRFTYENFEARDVVVGEDDVIETILIQIVDRQAGGPWFEGVNFQRLETDRPLLRSIFGGNREAGGHDQGANAVDRFD